MNKRIRLALVAAALLAVLFTSTSGCTNYGNSGGGMGAYPTPMPTTRPTM